MITKEINWNMETWTRRAFKLLEGIKQFPEDKKIIMLILTKVVGLSLDKAI